MCTFYVSSLLEVCMISSDRYPFFYFCIVKYKTSIKIVSYNKKKINSGAIEVEHKELSNYCVWAAIIIKEK